MLSSYVVFVRNYPEAGGEQVNDLPKRDNNRKPDRKSEINPQHLGERANLECKAFSRGRRGGGKRVFG